MQLFQNFKCLIEHNIELFFFICKARRYIMYVRIIIITQAAKTKEPKKTNVILKTQFTPTLCRLHG